MLRLGFNTYLQGIDLARFSQLYTKVLKLAFLLDADPEALMETGSKTVQEAFDESFEEFEDLLIFIDDDSSSGESGLIN